MDGILVSTARRHESIFSLVLSRITMPQRGGNQGKTSAESVHANDNAMLAQIMEKIEGMNTRIEALEARSRPPTPILPAAPSETPTPQTTTQQPEITPPEADKQWRPEKVGYFDGTSDVFALTDRLRSTASQKGVNLEQINLILVLKLTAFNWYQHEGRDNTKVI